VGRGKEGRGRGGRTRDVAGAPRPEAAESCTSHRVEGWRPSVWGEKPGQSKDQGATVNIYVTPPSTLSRPRLHRQPDVSAPQPSSSSLPHWMLSCVGLMTSRRAAGELDLPVC
jgi:hypothetical protein